MARFDFPIRTKLAIWAGLGVLLVAGMLAEQQVGDRFAAWGRRAANAKQLAAVEALRAPKALANMRPEGAGARRPTAPARVGPAPGRPAGAGAPATQAHRAPPG